MSTTTSSRIEDLDRVDEQQPPDAARPPCVRARARAAAAAASIFLPSRGRSRSRPRSSKIQPRKPSMIQSVAVARSPTSSDQQHPGHDQDHADAGCVEAVADASWPSRLNVEQLAGDVAARCMYVAAEHVDRHAAADPEHGADDVDGHARARTWRRNRPPADVGAASQKSWFSPAKISETESSVKIRRIESSRMSAQVSWVIRSGGAVAQRHGVGDDDAGERRGRQRLERVAARRGRAWRPRRPAWRPRRARSARRRERAAGVDDVVDDHRASCPSRRRSRSRSRPPAGRAAPSPSARTARRPSGRTCGRASRGRRPAR